MSTLQEEAKAYVPQRTKNIADLNEVTTDLEVMQGEGKDDKGKIFKYKYVELNGEQYRVPASVLGDLQEILKVKPNLKKFKVTKTGSGLNTDYKVIQLD